MPFCANCGRELQESAMFCPKCGTARKTAAAGPGDAITEALRTAGREMEAAFKTAGEEIDKAFKEARDEFSGLTGPLCSKCGKRNPKGAKFCYACGQAIPSAT